MSSNLNFIKKPHNPIQYKMTGCFHDIPKRFIFIHIYKNSSLAVRNALNMRGNYIEYGKIRDLEKPKICVIRNPINRIISSYLYILNPREVDRGWPDKHPRDLIEKSLFYNISDNLEESFTSFLESLDFENFYDAVTYPQSKFLSDKDIGIDDIEHVIIQENLNVEFGDFCKLANMRDANLRFVNISDPIKKKKLKKLISNSSYLKNLIETNYQKDFEMYEHILRSRKIKND
jgi:hypothetical protein